MTSLSGTPETTVGGNGAADHDAVGSSGAADHDAMSANGDHADAAARIRAFLVDTFLLGEDDGFADGESLLEQGIVDSTGVMELVAFLEGTFGIAVDDDELVAANLDSVDRMAAFVARKT